MFKLVSRANAWRLIVFVFLVWSLIIMAYFSAVPFFVLRYLFLPKDNFRIPIDFVSKNVSNPTITALQEQLVALAELKSLDNMSSDNYRIDLELTMPRCEINRKKGPFTIKGALSNYAFTHGIHTLLNTKDTEARKAAQSKTGVDIVERMAMLPYKSDAVETLSRYMFMPLLISDFKREESVIKVTLWQKAYRPKAKRPHLLITLPREIWVSEAHITFTVKVRGLKYYLKEYPISSFFVVSFFSFIGEVCSFAVIVGFFYLKMTKPSEPTVNRYVTSFTPSDTEQQSNSNRFSIITADGTKVYRDRPSFSLPSPHLQPSKIQSQPSTPYASTLDHSPLKKRPFSVYNLGEKNELAVEDDEDSLGGRLGALTEINDTQPTSNYKNSENDIENKNENESRNDNENGNKSDNENESRNENKDKENNKQDESDTENKDGNGDNNNENNDNIEDEFSDSFFDEGTDAEDPNHVELNSDNKTDEQNITNISRIRNDSSLLGNQSDSTDLSSSIFEPTELTQPIDDPDVRKPDPDDEIGLLTPRD